MVDWEHTKEIGETVEKLGFYLVHEYPDGISLARLVPADPRNADASITISEFCSRRTPFVIIDLDDCSQPQACSLGTLMNCHLDLNSAGGHEVFIRPRGDFRIRLESTNLLSVRNQKSRRFVCSAKRKKRCPAAIGLRRNPHVFSATRKWNGSGWTDQHHIIRDPYFKTLLPDDLTPSRISARRRIGIAPTVIPTPDPAEGEHAVGGCGFHAVVSGTGPLPEIISRP
jgi:hypothetical protein